MKGVVLLLLIAGVAFPYVVGFHVEPVKAQWSGWTGRGDSVAQTVTCNFDSLSYVELFAGTKGDSGTYTATVYDGNTQLMTSPGTQDWDCRWVRFEDWNTQVAFTKGKTLTIRFTRGGADSIEYYYDGSDPYSGYGEMIVGQSIPFPNPNDLACRVFGRLNSPAASFWGMDEWCFVPWCNGSEARKQNRMRLRQDIAQIAESARVGSIMTYARWQDLIQGDDTTRSWYDFDARLYSILNEDWANARAIINITGVAKYASSRYDSVWKRVWIADTAFDGGYWDTIRVWDTAVYCAPKNLWHTDTSNYWADYIKALVTHHDNDNSRSWPSAHPCDSVHVWEIWNEPNDTCTYSLKYLGGTTGWWRRPNQDYASGFSDLRGLCSLYVQTAYVAESVIRAQPGHQNDTILIGSTHRIAAEDDTVLALGSRFLRYCYEIAQNEHDNVFWDGVSVHPYQGAYGFDPDTFEAMAESVSAIARAFEDYDCQVWCSEVGVLYDWTQRNYINEHYQEDAVRYLPELYTTTLASQALPGARYDHCQWWWFSTTDTGTCYGLVGLRDINLEKDSGDGSWEVFASCSTFKTFADELAGLRFERRVLPDSSSESSRIYEFSDPQADDGRLWVSWAVEPTGRGNADVTVKVPARTDTVAIFNGSNLAIAPADADGWLRLTVSTQSLYMIEDGTAHRPDLVADSMRLVPPRPQVGGRESIYAWVKNYGNRGTPGYQAIDYIDEQNPSVVYLYWNDSLLDSAKSSVSIAPQQTRRFAFCIEAIPGWMRGQGLFRVAANPGERFVELGLDDNAAYKRVKIPLPPNGDLIGVVTGSHRNEPLPLLGLESHAFEADTTGQTPCDSARLVQWAYGNDTIVDGGDTTAWFCVNQAVSLDTTWGYLSGQSKYRFFIQVKDSWSESELIPDTVHPFVVFDTTGPSGNVVINGGARFSTSSSCSLRLAAHDSASGVASMRFINGPFKVNLVQNGMFAGSASSWSFAGSGSGYDSALQMAELSVGSSQSSVRQFIPAESISAHAGDSCVLEANVLALMHGGNASGDVSFWCWKTRQDTSLHDTAWTLIDSAGYAGDLLSLTGRSNLSKHFLLTTPSAESGWSWRGGMVRVEAHGVDTAVGRVWTDDIALGVFHPQSGDAWFGGYDTLSQWDIGSGAGRHIVTALYRDSSGNENSATYADTIMLDATPPVVHITLPGIGQMISGLLDVTGWGYDPVVASGDTWFKVRRLQYRSIDSTNWRPVLPDSMSHVPAYPDSASSLGPAVHLGYWSTTSVANGMYQLRLSATDSAGQTSSCTTLVSVLNGGFGGGFCMGPDGGGTGIGEGTIFVGSATGTVLHLSSDLDSLDTFQVNDSGNQAYVTAVLEVGSDSILVLDARNKRVHKLHRNGQGRRRLVSGLSVPMGLTRDDDGNFYLVDRGLHRIGKFRSNGTLVFTRGGLGTDSLHFHSPEAIAVKGRLVYVADTKNDRISVWDTSGNYRATITGSFANPTAVTVTDEGAIYLTDGSDGKLKGITPLGGNILTLVTPDSSKLRGLVPSEDGHWLFTLAPQPNKVYKVQIRGDESMPGGVQSGGRLNLPKTLSLNQPFPNPARTRLNIVYALPRQTRVSVRLYDVAGKLVTTLADGEQKPGYYNLTWNRQDTKGRSCACGVYFCTLAAENQRFSRKVVLTE